MMACIVKDCKSHRGIKGTDNKIMSFHKFPTHEVILNQWIKAVGRELDWTPKHYHTICSEHFTSECYIIRHNQTKYRKLIDSAVPTLKLPHQDNIIKQELEPTIGAYPSMLIVPLDRKRTSPPISPKLCSSSEKTGTDVPTPIFQFAKFSPKPTSYLPTPTLQLYKKSDCTQCLQYREQIQIMKKNFENLEQVAQKRFSKINELRQEVRRLQTINTQQHTLFENNIVCKKEPLDIKVEEVQL